MQRSSRVLRPMLAAVLLALPALVRCNSGDETITASVAQCRDWSRQASGRRLAAQDAADRACTVDADCELFYYRLRCFADCGFASAVASSAVPALEATVEQIDADNCDRFEAASCPAPLAPPCVPPPGTQSAVCRDARCTAEYL